MAGEAGVDHRRRPRCHRPLRGARRTPHPRSHRPRLVDHPAGRPGLSSGDNVGRAARPRADPGRRRRRRHPAGRRARRAGCSTRCSNRSRRTFNHCLCTPLWLVQQELRIGETRLMQVAYAELPAGPGRRRGPAQRRPRLPRPGHPERPGADRAAPPTWPARPADRAGRRGRPVGRPAGGRRTLDVRIDRIVAGPRLDRAGVDAALDRPPRVAAAAAGSETRSSDPDRAGDTWRSIPARPAVRSCGLAGANSHAPGSERDRFGGSAYDCRCSDLGLWSPALPALEGDRAGADQLPGPAGRNPLGRRRAADPATVLRDVTVTRAEDAAATRVGPSEPRTTGTWHYALDRAAVGLDQPGLADRRPRTDPAVALRRRVAAGRRLRRLTESSQRATRRPPEGDRLCGVKRGVGRLDSEVHAAHATGRVAAAGREKPSPACRR